MHRFAILAALAAGACTSLGKADVSGTIGEEPFDEAKTVYHGTQFIVLFDRKVDCTDTAFIKSTYSEGEPIADFDFVALQFTFDDDEPKAGTFSVAGDSAVTAQGLMNLRSEFALERAREGTLTVDEADEDHVAATFEVLFGQGGVSGEFETVHCRNLRQ